MHVSDAVRIMRITVNVPNSLGEETRQMARDENTSVSRVVTNAIELYVTQEKRKRLGKKVLRLAGKVHVADDALDVLDRGRKDDRP